MVINYKMTDIGIFPEDWEIVPFCDVFVFLSNNTLSRNQLNYNGGTVKNIHYGDVLILYPELLDCTRDDIPYVNEKEVLSCSTLEDGDIIFADTAEDGTVGKVTEIFNTQDLTVVSGLHTITCRVKDKKFAPGWLGYFLNSHFYHDQLLPYIHGTKVSSISKDSLCDTYIAMPSYDEQIEIVKALSSINAFIDKSEKLGKKYQSLKQACLQHMFPRVGQTEPDVRLPGFTDPWEQRKLRDLSNSYSGGTPLVSIRAYYGGNIPFIRSAEINSDSTALYLTNEGMVNSSAKMVVKGDILYALYGATSGEVGRAKINGAINQAILAIIPHDGYDAEFIMQWLRNNKSYIIGMYLQGGQGNLSGTIINNLDIDIPSYNEQIQIGKFFSKLDERITLHQRTCEKYKNIKQGMMEKLLSGKIRLV